MVLYFQFKNSKEKFAKHSCALFYVKTFVLYLTERNRDCLKMLRYCFKILLKNFLKSVFLFFFKRYFFITFRLDLPCFYRFCWYNFRGLKSLFCKKECFFFAVNYIIKSLDLKTMFYATKFHKSYQVSTE